MRAKHVKLHRHLQHPAAVERARSAESSPLPAGYSLLALHSNVGTQGGSLQATEVATSPDKGPEIFRALSGGPGTFRKQRQTTENDSKIIKIMKILKEFNWDLSAVFNELAQD